MVVRSQHAIRPDIQRTSAQMKVRKKGIWGTEHNGRFEFARTHLTRFLSVQDVQATITLK